MLRILALFYELLRGWLPFQPPPSAPKDRTDGR